MMLSKTGYWTEAGDAMFPNQSPVTDNKYWQVAGGLLALTLLAGENTHPVSPAVIYALLSNVHEKPNPNASMDLSLSFIKQLRCSKIQALIPWMIIPPDQDWRDLPDGHRAALLANLAGLEVEVGKRHLSSHVTKVRPFPATKHIHSICGGSSQMERRNCHFCYAWRRPLLFNNPIPGNGEGLQEMHRRGPHLV